MINQRVSKNVTAEVLIKEELYTKQKELSKFTVELKIQLYCGIVKLWSPSWISPRILWISFPDTNSIWKRR
jgi:hypothetical protein